MVLAPRSRLTPAVVVPDELSLTIWGHDPFEVGLEPTAAVGEARSLMLPDRLPQELVAALDELRGQLAPGVERRTFPAPLLSGAAPQQDEHARGHQVPEQPGDHAEHGHGHHEDMMAITGEPSADGLVMEPIEFRHGPLATGFPGGLQLRVELDGDVVSRCDVRATLLTESPPDPLAPTAWGVLSGTIQLESTREQVVAVELERALSHAAWLRGLGRLLGFAAFVEQCQAAVSALVATSAPPANPELIRRAGPPLARMLETLGSSLPLRIRLRGVGRAEDSGLEGPNARAGGHPRDARAQQLLYRQLGFEPVLEREGDALARARVRAREAMQSWQLALAALELDSAQAGAIESVEGPRGPLVAEGDAEFRAPGTGAALAAAGQAAVGLEWSDALVAVASFDLSPWQVPG